MHEHTKLSTVSAHEARARTPETSFQTTHAHCHICTRNTHAHTRHTSLGSRMRTTARAGLHIWHDHTLASYYVHVSAHDDARSICTFHARRFAHVSCRLRPSVGKVPPGFPSSDSQRSDSQLSAATHGSGQDGRRLARLSPVRGSAAQQQAEQSRASKQALLRCPSS